MSSGVLGTWEPQGFRGSGLWWGRGGADDGSEHGTNAVGQLL